MEFSRQEYWGGLPFPSPEDLPDSGTEPRSPALRTDALLPEPLGKRLIIGERRNAGRETRNGRAVPRRGLCRGPRPLKPDCPLVAVCWVTVAQSLNLSVRSLFLKWVCYWFLLHRATVQIHEGMFVKHTCLAQTSSCVIRILLMVVVMFIVTFFYSVTGFTFPFLRCVLDDPDTDFLKGRYVLGFMFCLYDCGPLTAVFFMTLVFFIVALSRTNSAVEIEMTTWFSVSPSQVYKSLKNFVWPELLNAVSLRWGAYRKCSWRLMLILKFAYILKRGLQCFGLKGEAHDFFYSSLGLRISEHQSLLTRV